MVVHEPNNVTIVVIQFGTPNPSKPKQLHLHYFKRTSPKPATNQAHQKPGGHLEGRSFNLLWGHPATGPFILPDSHLGFDARSSAHTRLRDPT